MEFRKTRKSEREAYTFDVITTDCVPEKVILIAGKDGISDVMVGREARKIEKLVKEDEILKKFFR